MSLEVNAQLAVIFDEIGHYLEFKNENPFKVKAYQKAARTLEGLSFSVATAPWAEVLETPGIGKAIGEKIQAYLQTGQIPLHQSLQGEFPAGLLQLLQLPRLGAKKVGALHRELGVTSIAELRTALERGLVAHLSGFGKKSEENLKRALEQVGTGEQRLHIGKANKIVQAIEEQLRQLPSLEEFWVAGSFRRSRETVGDIDLIVSCRAENANQVMEKFCSLVPADQVLLQGPTKSSLRWDSLQVDLRVIEPQSVGAALQYFTGSKDHNVAMRARAERRNLKLNEYGLFDQDGHNVLNGQGSSLEQEREIYQVLDLPYFAPELRELNSPVISSDGALATDLPDKTITLPNLVCESDILASLHNHSLWSDGRLSLAEVAEQGRTRGYRFLAVTDHSQSLLVANGLSIERLLEQGREIRELNKRLQDSWDRTAGSERADEKRCRAAGPFQLLWGTECDILPDGGLDYPDDVLAQLDWVVASVHVSLNQFKEAMTERILRALNNPYVRVLGHPTGRLLGKRDGISADWELIFKTAQEKGILLEINGTPRRQDLGDLMVRQASQMGCRFCLSTDAHRLEEFDNMRWAVGVARRAGLGPQHFANCCPDWSPKQRFFGESPT